MTRERLLHALLWLVIVLPALWQIYELAWTIYQRFGYPYDLEWMEGGMLHHALRIRNGVGIYVPPSIDFIPYLYTPLYPALLALFGGWFTLDYQLGRAFSVLALIGIATVTFATLASKRFEHARLGPAIAGGVIALGLFAAAYPFLDGWYDLVRADTLFLYMITAGIAGLPRWATKTDGWKGHAKVATGAALLALSFFCKQTGIFYVAFGGAIVVALAWRRTLTYVAMAGAIGLGFTWLLDRTTDGWFWTYVSKIHRAHDFNMDRFWKSFGLILWHFPAMTIVVGVALVGVGYTYLVKRALPKGAQPMVLWGATYVVSTVVGAIGWGTEFAHYNAFQPAFLHGAIAAGAAIPAASAVARAWYRGPRIELVATAAAVVVAIPLSITLYTAQWNPQQWVPNETDTAAGDKLIARMKEIDGDVWMPAHPWYVHLAGKVSRVHRMGVKDVSVRQPRPVAGLDEAVRGRAFAAIIVDKNLETGQELTDFPSIEGTYRADTKLPADEKPRVFSGARVVPFRIWVPAITQLPPNARVVFDFEQPAWSPWEKSGGAWGDGPITEPLSGQGSVSNARGQRFATSMHGGDAATGRVTSPLFLIEAPHLIMHLGGGTDSTKLRAELWIDGAIVATASVPPPGGDALRTISLDVTAWQTKQARLVLVDDSPTGHLDVDEVWLQ